MALFGEADITVGRDILITGEIEILALLKMDVGVSIVAVPWVLVCALLASSNKYKYNGVL